MAVRKHKGAVLSKQKWVNVSAGQNKAVRIRVRTFPRCRDYFESSKDFWPPTLEIFHEINSKFTYNDIQEKSQKALGRSWVRD